ncbi:hypothetical protein AC1031_021977 [Aphanomyces cochlioides]|nr:hypothetical protein AC1031_021977 [Aphanomyces cochlioides]
MPPSKKTSANLTNDQRQDLFMHLLELSNDRVLPQNALTATANLFGTSRQSVSRIWKRGLQKPQVGLYTNVTSRRKDRCGRKLKYVDITEKIRAVPLNERTTLRDLADAIQVPYTTLHRGYKASFFKKYTRPLKPLLTSTNMYNRNKWALSLIDSSHCVVDLENYVHVDEKCFFLKLPRSSFYGLIDEQAPARRVPNKNFVVKVMMICAVAKPRWDYVSQSWFDETAKIDQLVLQLQCPLKLLESFTRA